MSLLDYEGLDYHTGKFKTWVKKLLEGKSNTGHKHTKSDITDFPNSLPANGGNSSTVNGHTINSDVPENAVFTDTVYDDTEVKESIENLSSDLTSEISRAKETEETLKSRIDTITSLPEGSTTGDAELQDIRVKADGTTATSAGNAVREQISDLTNDLSITNEALTKVESFNKYNPNTIIPDTYFSANTGKQMVASNYYTTDYIPCDGKEKVYLTFVSTNGTVNFNTTIPRIVFYTAKNEDSILSFNQTNNVKNVEVPENAKYCRLALANAFKNVVVCISFNSYPTSISEIDTYFNPYYKKCLTDTDKEEIFNSIVSNNNNLEYGFLTKGNYNDADYCYIPVYGQSFTLANDGEYKITDDFDENCYMIGDSPKGYETVVDNPVINPLNTPNNFEYIQADMVSLISKLSKKYAHIKQNFLISGVGKGSTTILKLLKNNGINDYYNRYFLTAVTNTKTAMNNANKTFSCPFILYMQGESDYQTSDSTSCANTSNPKATYKERFITLKNNMQEDVMNATGQSYKPIIITYCVGGNAFNNKYEYISTAQLELAEENDDVICVGSYYYAPDYKYHLTPDGRRWFAEHLAKVFYESFIKGIDNTLKIGKITATKNKIYIPIHNAVLPLKFDTYTIGAEKNNGFMIYDSIGNKIIVSDIRIHDNVIVITTVNNISGNIKVTYGNSVCHGNGNVRDSDRWISYYSYESNELGTSSNQITYIPKDENGNELIGKKYPLWKWLPNFGVDVNVDNGDEIEISSMN